MKATTSLNIENLLNDLRSEDSAIRTVAVSKLGQSGLNNPEIVQALEKVSASDSNVYVAKAAGQALTAIQQKQGRFEVKFAKLLVAQSYSGDGIVKFEPEQMVLDGTLLPSIGFQLGVIAVVTVLPLVLYDTGLGILPALILAFAIGKKKTSRSIAYRDILDLTVQRQTVSITCRGKTPNKFKFNVAVADGERLYDELRQYYPDAIAAGNSRL